jgi:long-chain fatty acid transport protein
MKLLQQAALVLAVFFLSQSVLASSPGFSGLFATADEAETVATNPAGMSFLEEGGHAEVELMTIVSLDNYEVDQYKSTEGGGNPDDDYFPKMIPSIYYVNSLGEDWRYGVTLNIPSGFGSSSGNSWAGRYYSDSFSLFYVSLSPAMSYRVNEKLSLGAALNITYNYSESITRVNNDLLDPGTADGKFEYSAGAFGFSGTISMLYEFTDKTRVGLVYAGESEADLEDEMHFKNLAPNTGNVVHAAGLDGAELKVTNIMPQRVQAGVYHEMAGGNFFTVDGVWVDFSEFGTGDVSLDGDKVASPNGIYNDLWMFSVGYGFPVDAKMTYKVGAMYMSQGVDDEDRTLSIRLDEMFGAGVGFTRKLEGKKKVDVNFDVIYTGKSKVDTGDSLSRGRVVGESKRPYILALDIAYHW